MPKQSESWSSISCNALPDVKFNKEKASVTFSCVPLNAEDSDVSKPPDLGRKIAETTERCSSVSTIRDKRGNVFTARVLQGHSKKNYLKSSLQKQENIQIFTKWHPKTSPSPASFSNHCPYPLYSAHSSSSNNSSPASSCPPSPSAEEARHLLARIHRPEVAEISTWV